MHMSPGGVEPAGFGPISVSWPIRRRLLGSTPRRALEQRIAELGEDIDWTYFQAAPIDQRTECLRGDEWVLLDGLHPRHAVLTTRLPSPAAGAMVYTRDGARLPLRLFADAVAIDGDAERCSLTWRGGFAVPSEDALASIAVAAGIGPPGIPLALP